MKKHIYIKTIAILLIFIILLLLNQSLFADTFDASTLYSQSAVLLDAESGTVLEEKNAHEKVFPASTTKILTAILALEHLNLDDTVVVSKDAIYSTPAGSSLMYLKPDEVISIKNLLYGLLLSSGNDAANVLAETVSGSRIKFVALMNEKLKEIGCTNTNFTNAHGFHNKNHYTTAYDMAILMQYAMKNDTFRQIVETKQYTIPATNKYETRYLVNTNKMLYSKYTKMYSPYMLGGKTGYTDEARGTFVGYAKKDDKLVIVSVFDASQNISGNEGRFLDSISLLNEAFTNYTREKIIPSNTFQFSFLDYKEHKKYTLGLTSDFYSLIKEQQKEHIKISYTFNLEKNLKTELNSNVGKIALQAYDSTNASILHAQSDIVLLNIEDYYVFSDYTAQILIVLSIIILLLVLILLTLLIPKKKRKKRDNKKYQNRIKNSKKISKFDDDTHSHRIKNIRF